MSIAIYIIETLMRLLNQYCGNQGIICNRKNVCHLCSCACAKILFSMRKTATPAYYCVEFALNCVANCYATPDNCIPVNVSAQSATLSPHQINISSISRFSCLKCLGSAVLHATGTD